jgi:hypothetical protein
VGTYRYADYLYKDGLINGKNYQVVGQFELDKLILENGRRNC